MVFKLTDNRLLKTARLTAFVIVASLMSTACKHGLDGRYADERPTGSLFYHAKDEHPIEVSTGELSMSISVNNKDRKLVPSKRNELITFLHYYRDQGIGRIKVTLPANSYYQGALHNVLSQVQHEMQNMSLGPEVISVKRYQGRGDRHPFIHLSYKRYVAKGPDCGHWNENLNNSENNRNSHYWGCANQKNLAAMVANPRDLKGPRGWSPRDARRRDGVWDKWVKGEVSSSTRSQDERTDTKKK